MNTTRLFIYKLFGENAKLLRHDHNAISDNVIEGEEIYNVVLNKYNKPEACLNSLFRGIDQLVYQEFRINYILNKYNRKVKDLNSRYFEIAKIPEKEDLFVLNKPGGKNYEDFIFWRAIIFLNRLFPMPSQYEKDLPIQNGLYMIETQLKYNMILLSYKSRVR